MHDIALEGSEALLTQILAVLESLNANVEEVKPRLAAIENDMNAIKAQIKEIIEQGFVDGDLKEHRRQHSMSWIGRIFHKR